MAPEKVRSRRELTAALAFAVWGLCIAIATASVFRKPAPPDQPVSRGDPFEHRRRRLHALDALPDVAAGVAPGPPSAAFAPSGRRRHLGSLRGFRGAAGHPVADEYLPEPVLGDRALRHRRRRPVVFCTRDLQFTRRDFVLVPVFLTAWLAAIDIAPQYAAHQHVLVVSILILVLRIAVTFVPSRLPPAFAFVAAPLGLILQTGFFGRDQRYLGWHALAIVAITPFVLRVFLREERLALRSSRK
jgi:hypothetical protein